MPRSGTAAASQDIHHGGPCSTIYSEYESLIYAGGLLALALIVAVKRLAGRITDDLYDHFKERLGGHRQAVIAEVEPPQRPTMPPSVTTASPPTAPPQSPAPAAPTAVIVTAQHRYRLHAPLGQGDIAVVYAARREDAAGSEVVIKLARSPGGSDLMQTEIRTLRRLHAQPGQYAKHLPLLLDQFKTAQGQLGTVLSRLDGYDLYRVRERYPEGVPQQHLIRIFRRSLSVLGYAHSLGIVHGNVEPAHLLVRPRDHNVFLIDWCYAVYKPLPERRGLQGGERHFSAPEVAQRASPLPAADLYALGKCMIFLAGGDEQHLTLPDRVDPRLARFIQFFVRASPVQRAQDAWEMYGRLDQLREEMFGPHRFIEFSMD